jgi:hypothetical protein
MRGSMSRAELDAWCRKQRLRLDSLINAKKCPEHNVNLLARGTHDEGTRKEHTLYVCPVRGCGESVRLFKIADNDRGRDSRGRRVEA